MKSTNIFGQVGIVTKLNQNYALVFEENKKVPFKVDTKNINSVLSALATVKFQKVLKDKQGPASYH